MLRSAQSEGILSRADALRFIGDRFRIKMDLPDWASSEAVTIELLKYEIRSRSFIYIMTCEFQRACCSSFEQKC